MGSVKTENLERRDEPPPMVTVIKEEETSKDSDKVASPPAVVKEEPKPKEPALPEPVFLAQKIEVESGTFFQRNIKIFIIKKSIKSHFYKNGF